MSDTLTTDVTDEHADHHPSDRHYVNIAIALAVITGLEVAWSYSGVDTVPFIAVLIVMMAIKFFMVASQFMHLKFDDRILTRIFYAGLFLAVAVYLIALSTFHVFNV